MPPMQPSNTNDFARLNRTLHAMGVLGLGVMIGASFGLAYRPLSIATSNAQQRSIAIEGFLEQRLQILERYAEVHRQLTDHKARLSELLSRIPSDADEADFLAQLSELSNDTGVRIRQFDPGDSNDAGKYTSMEIDVVAEASYSALCRFLDGLAKLPRLSEVTALALSDVDATADVYPVTLTLRIYYAPLVDGDENREEADRA